mmetsp:Transcript_168874/g.542810  ORF Transcript_168874/g.542810 Transcript_168874/m.542810 type:complete len:218 (+) Transcript_168874:553-1206(+)
MWTPSSTASHNFAASSAPSAHAAPAPAPVMPPNPRGAAVATGAGGSAAAGLDASARPPPPKPKPPAGSSHGLAAPPPATRPHAGAGVGAAASAAMGRDTGHDAVAGRGRTTRGAAGRKGKAPSSCAHNSLRSKEDRTFTAGLSLRRACGVQSVHSRNRIEPKPPSKPSKSPTGKVPSRRRLKPASSPRNQGVTSTSARPKEAPPTCKRIGKMRISLR